MNEWKNLKKELSWFLLNIHCLIEFLNFDIYAFRKFSFNVLFLKMPFIYCDSLSRNTMAPSTLPIFVESSFKKV